MSIFKSNQTLKTKYRCVFFSSLFRFFLSSRSKIFIMKTFRFQRKSFDTTAKWSFSWFVCDSFSFVIPFIFSFVFFVSWAKPRFYFLSAHGIPIPKQQINLGAFYFIQVEFGRLIVGWSRTCVWEWELLSHPSNQFAWIYCNGTIPRCKQFKWNEWMEEE